jgi:hypothetical protein
MTLGGTVGVHVYWTRPRAVDSLPMSDVDVAVLAVSAVVWRARNGPIWLFTDHRGRAEMAEIGLLGLWDRVDSDFLEEIPAEVNAAAFWDLGKTLTLNRLPLYGCVLDLDLIVWEPFSPVAGAGAFLHWEAPVLPWYPGPDGLSVPPGYSFDSEIDWDAMVCNTAFMCLPNTEVREAFVEAAMRFALGNRPAGSGIAEMLFAGQRMLAHLIRTFGVRPRPLVDFLYVPCGESRWLADPLPVTDPLTLDACDAAVTFTHLWRHKHLLNEGAARKHFIGELERRCHERVGTAMEPWRSVFDRAGR